MSINPDEVREAYAQLRWDAEWLDDCDTTDGEERMGMIAERIRTLLAALDRAQVEVERMREENVSLHEEVSRRVKAASRAEAHEDALRAENEELKRRLSK